MIDESGFDTAISLLADLKTRRQLFTSLKPPFVVTFEVNSDVLTDALGKSNLSKERFATASREIGEMVLSILADRTGSLKDQLADEDASAEMQADQEGQLQQRVARVADVLVDEELKNRYQLKVASKAPAFSSIDWDVKEKKFDARLGPVRLPYATVRMRWQKEFEYEFETLFQRNLFDSVQINMTRDELEYVIQELARAMEQLDDSK